MLWRPWLAIAHLAGLTLVAAGTHAQTVPVALRAPAFFDGACLVNTAGDLKFGARGAILANVDADGAIAVGCTDGTAFSIGLGPGTAAAATTAARWMTGDRGAVTRYTLYQDAARTQLWGDTVGSDTLAATGDGRLRDYPVYGRMPPQIAPAAGEQGDTVAVTLTY